MSGPRFLVRTDESAVLVTPASIARKVAHAFDEVLRQAQTAGVIVDADVVAWSRELRALSDLADARTSDATSVRLPLLDGASSVVGRCDGAQVDVATAAASLECGPRNVVDLVRRGVLSGEKRGGRWLIDAASVAAHQNRRNVNHAQ